MAVPAENILQSFFETSMIECVSDHQLQQLAEEQPFYGGAHFLLAKKLYQSKQDGYEQALQKAALHFPNELFLHFSLEEEIAELHAIKIPNHNEIVVVDKDAENDEETEDEEIFDDEEVPLNDFTEEAILNTKLSSILQDQAAEFQKPVENTVEIPVETTPYHRIDYFDSQGIKLEDERANDKLGTQLRRFTDWLKQMKRANPNPTELKTDEAGEHQVKNIAEHSNEPEEIITEAMAEVLLKQGKPEQAIHIHEKLSFNNPSKSVYFAAKIKEIKVKQ